MREKIFTVRHLRLVGNPRLRQLRAVCNSNTCPVGSPFLGSVTSETSLSCTPAFEKGTTYGEDKTPMVGMVSQHRYEWSDQDLVPNGTYVVLIFQLTKTSMLTFYHVGK